MQLFNVMTGGRMIHHLEGHVSGYHLMKTATGEVIYVNSCHHQVILPSRKTKVVGWTEQSLSEIYIGERDKEIRYGGREIEAAIFPEIGAFGVQYHPEVSPKEFDLYSYFYNMVRYALTLPWDEFIKAYTVGTDVELFENVRHSSAAG
jgi:carbamoylphosphate synthase small subunit